MDKNQEPESTSNSLISNNKSSIPDHSKRRLLRGVVGTTPVILAVSSKPVLAGWCTVSGFLSGNLSQTHGHALCGGYDLSYWQTNVLQIPASLKFADVFGADWYDSSGTSWSDLYGASPKLRKAVLFDSSQDQYQFGAYSIAAYMNALTGYYGSTLTTSKVVEIVWSILSTGVYTDPSTFQTLDAQHVVTFFSQTFDA